MLLLSAILFALLVDRISSPAREGGEGTGSGVAATQARSFRRSPALSSPGPTTSSSRSARGIGHRSCRRQPAQTSHDASPLGAARDRDDPRQPQCQEPDVRNGERALARRPPAPGRREHLRDRDQQPGPDRGGSRGAATSTATGSTTELDVTLSGHGTALLGQLIARHAKAALSGDGSITLTATHSLSARVAGSGTVLYGGNPPHVTQRVTGSGTISAG